jgi:dihydrofolate synthase/folylpolyglutamate synthase
MNFAQAVEHLYALGPELAVTPGAPRRKFDLAHMRALCAALGDPQREVQPVLIAGTNGKGSTAATLASILAAAGYRTGVYTSPHLVAINERIQTSDRGRFETISDDDFARLYTQVDEACTRLVEAGQLPVTPSFFERVTAIAFLYFAPRADIVVLEVGLGGRLDATNVVEPLVSVITDIALDHQEYLGNTIAEIAREKCGILRPRGTLVTLSQHPEANQAIGEAATALEVRGVNAGDYLPPAQRNGEAREPLAHNTYRLRVANEQLQVDSPLIGAHQQRNLALAIAAALELRNHHGYNIANAAIEAGIRDTRWPGRLELMVPGSGPALLLDVAHNPAGAWTLRAALAALPESQPRTLLFSCLRDKDLTEMSRILFPLFDSSTGPGTDPLRRHDHIILAPIASPRAASVEDLLAAARALGIPAHASPHLAAALAQAHAMTPPAGLIVATGSVYLVGEIRQLAIELAMATL